MRVFGLSQSHVRIRGWDGEDYHMGLRPPPGGTLLVRSEQNTRVASSCSFGIVLYQNFQKCRLSVIIGYVLYSRAAGSVRDIQRGKRGAG
jgi:hypothetical protein